MDIRILLALQEFRNGAGAFLADFLSKMTFLGELNTVLVIMAVVYWCVSRDFGTYLLMGWSGNRLVNGTLKVTACAYRPWIRDARIVPYGNSMTTATGYSFPSGHTMNGATVYGGAAVRKDMPRLLRVVLGIVVALVAFSRNYLGVHTPQDVLVGAAAGLLVMWLTVRLMGWIADHPEKDLLVCCAGIGLAIAVALYAGFKPYPEDFGADGKLLVDGAKMANDTFKSVGWCAAFLCGWILERRFVRFSTDVPGMTKAVRLVTGVLGYYIVSLIFVPLLKGWIPGSAGTIVSCFLQMFYISFLFPCCLRRMEKNAGGDTRTEAGGRSGKGRRFAAMVFFTACMLSVLQLRAEAEETEADPDSGKTYTLDRVVVLSRHNIRSPLSGGGSVLDDITPHSWFDWSSDPGELSVRGGALETIMGQYFRQWLVEEGLFPKNYQPEEGAVRFYANSKQRTMATAKFFSAGLLPVWDTPIETHVEYDTMDPVFNPAFTFTSPAYEADILSQIAEMGGDAGVHGIHDGLQDAIALLMDVTDMEESEGYQAGKYGNLPEDADVELLFQEGEEPGMQGYLKTANSVVDALTLQYYEEPDALKAAFGHELNEDDWRLLHSIADTYNRILFTAPLVSVNEAHPLLQEIRSELLADGRKFTFLCGHDSNIGSVLSALGVKDYSLPDTIEPKTPIGVKLVLSRYLNPEKEAFYTVRLVYHSTRQLRELTLLTPENPPMEQFLEFEGVQADKDHMISEEDLIALFDGAISAYDELLDEYAQEAYELAA